MGFDALIKLGPLVLFSALGVMFAVYFMHRKSAGRESSAVRYFGLAFVVGFVGYFAGMAAGIYAACSSPDSGNLCGLVGVFGIGPLLSSVVVFIHSLLWARKARAAS